jgi:hypothetical protein
MSTITKAARKMRRATKEGSLAHRALTVTTDRHPWYDWGHRLMILVGENRTGDYGVPRGRDLWYRFADENEARGRIITTHRYADVRATQGQDVSWRVFDVQDEGGTVKLGYWGDRIAHYGLSRRELALFRRWDFWECRVRGEWFGLRRWLYFRGLHAAVQLKKPFACNVTPPRGTGGYSHWHCELRGRHDVHRFRNYTWAGGTARVEYDPKEATA